MAEYNLGTAHGTVKIDADTTGVDNAGKSLDNLTGKGKDTGAALQTVGTTMGVAGLAIAGGLGVAVVTAANFEQGLSGIKAVSGATASEMDKIRDAALRIGKDTTFSASEASAAMEELVKAGISVDDVLNGAADATVNLAAATGVDMTTAASIASNAMNVFTISAQDMDGVVDTIAQTANASAIDVNDFGMSLSQVGAVADLVGLSFEDTAIAIGEMGDAGIKGSDAGTSLKTMLMNLQPSTKAQTEEFRKLGIITEDGTNRFYDQEGKVKSLRDVQQILTESVGELGKEFYNADGSMKSYEEQQALIAKGVGGMAAQQRMASLEVMFGSDAIRAAAVMAEGGAKSYDEFAKKQEATGTAAEQAKTRMDNLKGTWEGMRGSVETLGIIIGTTLIPPLKILVGWLGSLFDWFSSLPGPVQTVITYFAAGAAGVLLLGAGIIKAVGFFSKMSDAITTLIPALGRKNAAEAASAASSEKGAIRTAAAWVGAQIKAVAAWVAMAASAVLNAVKITVIWITETARAAAAIVASWIATAATTIARWVAIAAAAVTHAAAVAATWIAQTAAATAALVAQWVAATAKAIAQWVLMGVRAAAQAAIVAAAWLLQNGVAVATSLASLAVAVATTVAGWITMAITATINAIIVAAAWLIAFWPIVLVVALIIGLAALIYIFWDEIVAAFEAAKNWIAEKMNQLWEAIKAAWDWIVQKFQEAWQWIKGIFQGIIEAIVSAWDTIVQAFEDAKNWIGEKLTALWNKVVEIWNNVINWFKEIPGKIAAIFSGAASWLVDKGGDILSGLWNGIKNIWNSVTGWFSQVGGWVKDKFSGALNWLVSAGGDLIRGLWNGIVSVKDWIMNKIGGFVSSVLSGIKSFFGIGSPSKETAWMGEMLSLGLANGIEDNARPAVNAAVSTAQQVLEGMEKALADGATLEAAMKANLTPGALASLRGGAPTLAATMDTLASGSRPVRASDTPEGTEAAFQKIVKMEFNTYNPIAERASDNEARKIRAAAAVGAF